LRRIAVFQTGTPVTVQTAIVTESGSTLLNFLPVVNAVVLKLPPNSPEAALASLLSRPEVVEIHEDPVISAEALESIEGIEGTLITPTDPPVGKLPWNLHQIDIEHIGGATGKGIGVAVLDTGIDYSHPDLAARVVDCYNARAGEDATDCMDYNGHGTHIAGIIAANVSSSSGGPSPRIGVAREARLIAVRVLNDAGGGFVSDLINGLSWVYSRPYIRVVNMSLGFYKGSPYPLLERVVKLLYDAGVVMVAAAGNYKTGVQPAAGSTSPVAAGEGGEALAVAMNICIPADAPTAGEGGEALVLGADNVTVIQDPTCNKLVKFPARYPETIAVAAADMDLHIAYYSIRGAEVDIAAPGGTRLHPVISTTTTQQGVVTCIVDVSPVAAGEGGECLRTPVATPVGGAGHRLYGRGSGTSQATAHVTSVVALMLHKNPTLTPDEVRMILYETAADLGVSALAQGTGLIRAGDIVDALDVP
jgi:subtilisin family serine protease